MFRTALPLLSIAAALAAQPSANTDVRFHAKPKALPKGAATHDWTSFLGPNHNATSTETKLLHQWPAKGPNIVWELPKGTGYASPAIAGDRLVFLHRRGNREIVECLHPETGERYWQFTYPTQYEDRYGYNNGPRASPVIDGDRVFIYGAEGKLHCLRLRTGEVIWKRDILGDYKVPQDFFGVSSTPLVEGDLLIVQVGAPEGPAVVGLDKTNGKQIWGAGKDWGASYSSPTPAVIHGKRRVLVFAGGESKPPAGGLLSIDPANGAVDFAFPWRSKSYESVNAACPIVFGNNILISATYKAGAAMLNVSPDFKVKTAWTQPEFDLHFNTPIEKDGYIYGFAGRNEPDASLACVEAKTGKVAWRVNPEWKETFEVNGGKREQLLSTYRGSLLHVDGGFLALGELGHLLWLDLTPKGYTETSRAWLFAARQSWTLPVLSRGLLYVVQNERDALHNTGPRLICYDMRAAK